MSSPRWPGAHDPSQTASSREQGWRSGPCRRASRRAPRPPRFSRMSRGSPRQTSAPLSRVPQPRGRRICQPGRPTPAPTSLRARALSYFRQLRYIGIGLIPVVEQPTVGLRGPLGIAGGTARARDRAERCCDWASVAVRARTRRRPPAADRPSTAPAPATPPAGVSTAVRPGRATTCSRDDRPAEPRPAGEVFDALRAMSDLH
jgi:hypothetical protein